MVWAHHGIVTWGDTARESYQAMIEMVSRAEAYAAAHRAQRGARGSDAHATIRASAAAAGAATGATAAAGVPAAVCVDAAVGDLQADLVPVVRGLLAARTDDCDRPYRRVAIQILDDPETMAALVAPGARETLVTPPLTTDHLIRTKPLPLWIEGQGGDDPSGAAERIAVAVETYCLEYEAYVSRHAAELPADLEPFDSRPRVVMIPGVGVVCAGPDLEQAAITRDITRQTIAVKSEMAAAGVTYRGLPEDELFRMEYRTLQHAKLKGGPTAGADASAALRGHVALVTGAAGAIGTGICEGLLGAGCLVAATDLPGKALDELVRTLGREFPGHLLAVPLDVTDPDSVAGSFKQVVRTWGGIDLVIPNAGVAAVAPLTELSLDRYRALERVNVEGTLLVLAEAARLFRHQGTGGDVVLVSTKNVFSPGANFGAYSSTKAAAHQLARIASLEFAADDVRVNMVSPDAVFAHGTCRSGLWAEVGPDRMKARGLDEAGLEAYYQSRNLLKAQVTTRHVANAVLFFATRQTPTTGATIPVDGGLPDSTPR